MLKLIAVGVAAYIALGYISAKFHMRYALNGKRYRDLPKWDQELVQVVAAIPIAYWVAFGYHVCTDGLKQHQKRKKSTRFSTHISD